MGYEEDIRLEHTFSGQIKALLGQHFFTQDVQRDKNEATDFATYTIHPIKVGARLRTYRWWNKRQEFTIRWSRPSGCATEIHKIRAKLVQYLFYGFVDEQEQRIIQYFIGDLAVFCQHEPKNPRIYPNDPPDSQLAVFNISSFPHSFIVASRNLPAELYTAPLL